MILGGEGEGLCRAVGSQDLGCCPALEVRLFQTCDLDSGVLKGSHATNEGKRGLESEKACLKRDFWV